MQKGISVEEACARRVIGNEEDFERSCNPDGTAKSQTNTTTFSLKDSGATITLNNTYLYIGGAAAIVVAIVLLVVVINKLARRTK